MFMGILKDTLVPKLRLGMQIQELRSAAAPLWDTCFGFATYTTNNMKTTIGFADPIAKQRFGDCSPKRSLGTSHGILMILAAPLGPLLLAMGLDYLWLGKTLTESLLHWSSSALGAPLGILTAFLIVGFFRRWRAGKAKQSPESDHTA